MDITWAGFGAFVAQVVILGYHLDRILRICGPGEGNFAHLATAMCPGGVWEAFSGVQVVDFGHHLGRIWCICGPGEGRGAVFPVREGRGDHSGVGRKAVFMGGGTLRGALGGKVFSAVPGFCTLFTPVPPAARMHPVPRCAISATDPSTSATSSA